jgi:hypothetical protein
MGVLDRFRRAVQDRAGIPPEQREIGPSLDDLDRLRRALRVEADRVDRSTNLSLSIFLEQTELAVAGLDIYAMFNHLAAEGELTNYRQDSFGHAHFDIGTLDLPD